MRQQSSDELVERGAHPLAGLSILQIIPELHSGGAEVATIDIVAALAEAGARPLVASEGGRMVSELQAKGGVWLPFPASGKNPVAAALNPHRLARLLDQEKVALVQARSRATAWAAYGASRRAKIPFVTTYHSGYSGNNALALRYNSILARGDTIIADSADAARHAAELYPFAAAKIRVIERGIDLRVFNPQEVDPARVKYLRQIWGVASDERIVLLAARLAATKGHKTLIEAARLLAAAGLAGTKFILAGDDRERAYAHEIDAAIAESGLTGTVRRVGHCGDMPAALLAAAVAVAPSTQQEAFGRIAVEAQAMGTPVVVSDLCGLSEVILSPPEVDSAFRTGWRVPSGDGRALAKSIFEALTLGAAARDAFLLRARAHVLNRFSVERMKAETLAAYAALVQTQG